jgi:hypothetical protein
MPIRSTTYVVDMSCYPVPGSLDEQGVGRPILELRDLWGRIILHATKAGVAGGGLPSAPCPCGSAKKPRAGRIAIGAGKDGTLAAQCDRCAFYASISGWAASWWDWSQG